MDKKPLQDFFRQIRHEVTEGRAEHHILHDVVIMMEEHDGDLDAYQSSLEKRAENISRVPHLHKLQSNIRSSMSHIELLKNYDSTVLMCVYDSFVDKYKQRIPEADEKMLSDIEELVLQ